MIRRTIRGLGEALITFGLIILLFAVYEVYGKAFQVNAEKGRLDSALDQQWKAPLNPVQGAQPAAKPIPGNAIARLYIPRLDNHWVVVEGVEPKDIKLAPGHYPKSQLPGQVGNFAVAGHRLAAVFLDLDKVKNGDKIVVETQTGWFIYRVDKTHIIRPTEVDVVSSNPDKPQARPTEKYLTLTTCNPKWDNYQRLVVRAVLERQQGHDAGRPAEAGEA